MAEKNTTESEHTRERANTAQRGFSGETVRPLGIGATRAPPECDPVPGNRNDVMRRVRVPQDMAQCLERKIAGPAQEKGPDYPANVRETGPQSPRTPTHSCLLSSLAGSPDHSRRELPETGEGRLPCMSTDRSKDPHGTTSPMKTPENVPQRLKWDRRRYQKDGGQAGLTPGMRPVSLRRAEGHLLPVTGQAPSHLKAPTTSTPTPDFAEGGALCPLRSRWCPRCGPGHSSAPMEDTPNLQSAPLQSQR